MIKIAFIVEATLGGVRRHVFDLIRNLDSNGYKIYLIYNDKRADSSFFDLLSEIKDCVKLIKVDSMERSIGLSNIKSIRDVTKILKEIKPDIVHCHSSIGGICGRIGAKMAGIKAVIYTPHAYAFQDDSINKFKRFIYIFVERTLSRYFTSMTINVSKGEKECALKKRIDKDNKFTVIYNGIPDTDLPDKSEMKSQLGLKEGIYYIGTAARCAKQKDPMTFLNIAENVVKERDDVEFLYLGKGDMESEMRAFIKSHKLKGKVHMMGFRGDAERIISVFDVYLNTALYEAMPYSMIEAMRAGVPIIATNVTGNNEIVIDGENGKLFSVGEEKNAAEIIIDQVDNYSIQVENVKNAFHDHYSLYTMINRINTVYQRYGGIARKVIIYFLQSKLNIVNCRSKCSFSNGNIESVAA